jgi:hypothetical protein
MARPDFFPVRFERIIRRLFGGVTSVYNSVFAKRKPRAQTRGSREKTPSGERFSNAFAIAPFLRPSARKTRAAGTPRPKRTWQGCETLYARGAVIQLSSFYQRNGGAPVCLKSRFLSKKDVISQI